MTADEIAELARTKQPFPDDRHLTESALYYTLRGIYNSYEAGELTLGEAKRKKQQAMREFESVEMAYNIYIDHGRRICDINLILSACDKCSNRNKCKCEQCKQIAKIFDHRQQEGMNYLA